MKDQKVLQRFWSKVQVCDHGQQCDKCCWPWIGALVGVGYGQFFLSGSSRKRTQVKIPAHAFMYCLTVQIIEDYGRGGDKANILHSCDNPPCCNWHHLFVGTHQHNMDDMQKKGRDNYVHNLKIPDNAIPEIFTLYAEGYTQREIGDMWNVHNSHIGKILAGQKRREQNHGT